MSDKPKNASVIINGIEITRFVTIESTGFITIRRRPEQLSLALGQYSEHFNSSSQSFEELIKELNS